MLWIVSSASAGVLHPVAEVGETAPTALPSGRVFRSFWGPHVNASDALVFGADTCPASDPGCAGTSGVYLDDGTSLRALAERGEPVLGNRWFGRVSRDPALNDLGDVVYGACLQTSTTGLATIPAIFEDGAAGRTLLANNTTQLAGCTLLPMTSCAQPLRAHQIDDAGDVVFGASVVCSGLQAYAVFAHTPGVFSQIAREEVALGSDVVGLPSDLLDAVYGTVADFSTNADGQVALWARVGPPRTTSNPTYQDAVFLWSPPSGSTPAASRFVWRETSAEVLGAAPVLLDDGSVQLSIVRNGSSTDVRVYGSDGALLSNTNVSSPNVTASDPHLWGILGSSGVDYFAWPTLTLAAGRVVDGWEYNGWGVVVSDRRVPAQLAVNPDAAGRPFVIQDGSNGVVLGKVDTATLEWVARIGQSVRVDGVNRTVTGHRFGSERDEVGRAGLPSLLVGSDRAEAGLALLNTCSAPVVVDFQDGGSGIYLKSALGGDFNDDGATTVQDIFDLLTAWFAGDAEADINDRDGVTVQDIFDFLTLWFSESSSTSC